MVLYVTSPNVCADNIHFGKGLQLFTWYPYVFSMISMSVILVPTLVVIVPVPVRCLSFTYL